MRKPGITESDALALVNDTTRPNGRVAERVAQEEMMLRNMAFFAGKQHFHMDGFRLRAPINLPRHRVLYKANFILPAVQKAVAKLMDVSPVYSPVPPNDTPRSLALAELTGHVLEQVRKSVKHDVQKLHVMLWAAICGTGFTKYSWDARRGERRRYYWRSATDRSVALDLTTEEKQLREQEGWFDDLAAGDIREDVLSPFAVKEDPSARGDGVEAAQWMAHEQLMDRRRAAELFKMDLSTVPKSDPGVGGQVYEDAIAFMTSSVAGPRFNVQSPTNALSDRVLVCEYYHRATKDWPNGLKITTVGGVLAPNGLSTNPFCSLRDESLHLPFVKWVWFPSPGRWWGDSLAELLTSSQAQYNKARGTMTELQNVHGHPITFVPEGSGIPTGNMTIAPGSIQPYRPAAGKIAIGPTPNLPKEVYANAEIAHREIQQLSADSDPDMSKLPGQIRSGEGIRLMQEEKNAILAPVALEAHASEERAAKLMLGLARKHYGPNRLLRYRGDGKAWVVRLFHGADLVHDIELEPDPQALLSATARAAEVLDMVAVGALNPVENPDDRAAVARALHFKLGRDVMDEKVREEQNQQREIEEVYADPARFAGRGMPINEWDDHEAHARALREHLRSERFRHADPLTQGILFQHWKTHQSLYQQAVQQNMEAVAGLKGAAGQKGTASQPRR